jgi:uncharacterized protein YdiU (UPF0061 family)
VFSSIDRQGRYGYSNQPNLAAWNMAQLATALLPLAENTEAAIARYTEIVKGFGDIFEAEYAKVFAAKLGLATSSQSSALTEQFLKMMGQTGADFTQSFRALGSDEVARHIGEHPEFVSWHADWQASADLIRLNQINPALIPRNHLVEAMIDQSVAGNMQIFHVLYAALQTPFVTPPNPEFMEPPKAHEVVQATFCGT